MLRFLKWPSAHEVDFGDFLLEFEFMNGLVCAHYPDGNVRQLARFSPQKRGTSITSIIGRIRVGEDYLVELQPATAECAAMVNCSSTIDDELSWQLQMDSANSEWLLDGRLVLKSAIEGRDAFLKVRASEESLDLAVVLASLIVFLRFSG